MKAVFGMLGLLVVVAAVGLLAKKQLAGLAGAGAAPGIAAAVSASAPAGQQLQNQVRKSVEDAMRQGRPESDDK